MTSFLRRLTRRKTHGLGEELNEHGNPKLARVLGPIDLIFLGVGSTLGVGVYVLAGEVAKNNAGPAVCISFLVAAVASAFAALCYAEFGARVPKAGSAYVYSYVTVGELMAFVIGWNLILEYLIGTASVAKSFSENFDKLVNRSMSAAFIEYFPIDANGLGLYVDWFSFSMTLLLSVLLAFGIKGSSLFTNIFTCVNLLNVLLVIIAGLFFVDAENWAINPNSTELVGIPPSEIGVGGFAPFGFAGIMDGAATCFFAFVGFDSIASTSEEAKNPRRDIPLSIMTTLVVVFLAYFGVSTVLTLIVPYYLQDPNTPLVSAFQNLGQDELATTVSIGSLFGISASLLGAMIPLPRIVYAMSRDGLVFRLLGRINRKTQTPILATALLGLFAAVLSMIFDLGALIDMMSIGTLLAYTLVAVSVLIIRFTHYDEDEEPLKNDGDYVEEPKRGFTTMAWLGQTTQRSQLVAYIMIAVYCVVCVALALILVLGEAGISDGSDMGLIVTAGILGAVLVLTLIGLALQPRSERNVYFMVPLVPLVPCLSVFINIYLMMRLEQATWIRFGVWMAVGFMIYFGYGVWFSSEEYVSKGKAVPGEGPLLPIVDESNGEANKAFENGEELEMKIAAEGSGESNGLSAGHIINGAIINEAFDDSDEGGNNSGLRKFATLEALHKADSLLTQDSASVSDSVSSIEVDMDELVKKQQAVLNGTLEPERNPVFVSVPIEAEEKSSEVFEVPHLTDAQQEAVNAMTVVQTAIHFGVSKMFPATPERVTDDESEDELHVKLQKVFDGTVALKKAEMFVPIPCPPKLQVAAVAQQEIPHSDEIEALHKMQLGIGRNIGAVFAQDGCDDPLHSKLRKINSGLEVPSPLPAFVPVPLERKVEASPPVEASSRVQPDPELLKLVAPLIENAHLAAQSCFLHKRIPKNQPNLLPMMSELKSKVVETPAEDFKYEIPPSAAPDVPKRTTVPSPANKDVVSALKDVFASRQELEEGIDNQPVVLPSKINGKIE